MNWPASNSGGSAGPFPPPPPIEFFLVLPDGSCIPATPDRCRIVLRQVRSELRKQAKIKRHEKAVELQMAIEDRAAAWSVQRELTALHRGSIRWTARFKVRAEPKKPEMRTSQVTKRVTSTVMKVGAGPRDMARAPSSWVVDAMGMKGVIWQQSYLGRRSLGFHRGAARENWEYIVRDEAVLLDGTGEPIIISNMGDDWVEIGAGWQAMEDASTRANAKIQLLAIAPFDSDMSEAEMIAALRHFCTTVLDPLDLPYSAAIHAPPAQGDQRNFHPHIAFALRPMRRVEPYCWEVADDVCGELDGRDGVQMLRHLWAHSMSIAAEETGSNRRYTGLGYGARRLNLEPGEHLGEARGAIVARGDHVWAHDRNRIKAERNAARRAIRDADHKIAALTTVRDAALKRIEQHVGDVAARRIMRAASPVSPAITLAATDDVAQATMRAASPAIVPAAVIDHQADLDPALPMVERVDPIRRNIFAGANPVEPKLTWVATHTGDQSWRAREATHPVRPAGRIVPARSPVPAVRYSPSETVASAGFIKSAIAVRSAAPALATTKIPALARNFAATQPTRPAARLAIQSSVVPDTGVDPGAALLDLLAIARSARIRRRRKATIPSDLRLNTLPILNSLPTIDALPSLEGLSADAGVQPPVDALSEEDARRVARLTAIDAYVADYGGGDCKLETDYPVLKVIGVGWDWLTAPGVQQALRVVRDEQQQVVAALADEAAGRPLAFAKTGSRFWPRDLPAGQLRRLDHWARDPGFQHDAFGMEQAIARAHVERDNRRVAAPQLKAPAPIPDGFGGWRDRPAPVFHEEVVHTRLAPFDPLTGKPTDQLLLLLMLTGQYPRNIEFAHDGRLMAQPGKPRMLSSLLHPWRHDDRVAALVSETVRASREAGSPVWPDGVASAVRAYAVSATKSPDGGARPRPPGPDRGSAR